MAKIMTILVLLTALSACQNQSPNNEQTFAQENPSSQTKPTIPTHSALKNQTIAFQREVGNYPILIEKDYQAVNDDIAKLIQGLMEFDKQFDKENIGGVHSLNYSIINHDDKLAIIIDYSVSDMTSRYFQKYYQLDLKTKQQILLNEYLNNSQINITKINENLNQFLDDCRDERTKSEQCNDMSLYYFAFGGVDNSDIDILEHHTGFYILDKDHIVIGFDSAKFTTSFKINIKTYQVEIN